MVSGAHRRDAPDDRRRHRADLGVADGQIERTLPGESVSIASVAFSPDGQILATGGFDRIVHLWNVADGSPLRTLGDLIAQAKAAPGKLTFGSAGEASAGHV